MRMDSNFKTSATNKNNKNEKKADSKPKEETK